MTTSELLEKERTQNGILSVANEGWYAISREGLHMITFYKGKYEFSRNDDVIRFYKTTKSFCGRVSQLLNRGY